MLTTTRLGHETGRWRFAFGGGSASVLFLCFRTNQPPF